jgi:hypothetical protein
MTREFFRQLIGPDRIDAAIERWKKWRSPDPLKDFPGTMDKPPPDKGGITTEQGRQALSDSLKGFKR